MARGCVSPRTAAKVAYLSFYGGTAALSPFLAVYYQGRGFSTGAIGLLAGLPLLVGIVAVPVWSLAADASRRHARVLALLLLTSCVLALLLGRLSAAIAILLVALAHAFVSTPIQALLDNGAIASLGTQVRGYGRLRVWGTIGWGLGATIAGWAIGHAGLSVIFAIYAALLLITVPAAVCLPADRRPEHGNLRDAISVVRRDRRLWHFLLVALVGGIGVGIANGWFLVYLRSMGASSGQLGLALLIQTISETPVMLLAPRILRRFDARHLFVIAYVLYGLRSFGYAAAHTPVQLLVIQVSHGVTFSLMWLAGVALTRRLAPRGLGATLQGLFWTITSGVGGAVGIIAGGLLFATVGPNSTFAIAGALLALGVPAVALGGRALAAPRGGLGVGPTSLRDG